MRWPALALCVLAGCHGNPSAPPPTLEVVPDRVDFGPVDWNAVGVRVVLLHNLTDHPLPLPRLAFGKPALFSVQGSTAASIAAGQSVQLTLGYKPAGLADSDMLVLTTGDDGGLSVPLVGQGVGPQLSLNPAQVDLGRVALNASLSFLVTATNTGTVPVQVKGGSTNDARLPGTASALQLRPGESKPLQIELGALTLGPSGATVFLNTDPSIGTAAVGVSFDARATRFQLVTRVYRADGSTSLSRYDPAPLPGESHFQIAFDDGVDAGPPGRVRFEVHSAGNEPVTVSMRADLPLNGCGAFPSDFAFEVPAPDGGTTDALPSSITLRQAGEVDFELHHDPSRRCDTAVEDRVTVHFTSDSPEQDQVDATFTGRSAP